MNINSTDIVAYLGALAWAPQILKFGYSTIAKPKITITPEKNVSMGFTVLGPIFNLRLSINVDRKDTLIDYVGVKLEHEDGSAHNFEWAGMSEFFSEVKNNKGESNIVQRDIVPISIKLSTLSIVERFFRFQESSFIEKNKSELDKLMEHNQLLKKTSSNYPEEFLKSKEFIEYLSFFKEHFWWKVGTYTVSFYVRSPMKVTMVTEVYEFRLTQNEIDSLESNLKEIKNPIENIIKGGAAGYIPHPDMFAWLTISLKKR